MQTTLMVLWFATFAVYVLPRLVKRFVPPNFGLTIPEPQQPKSSIVRLFNGPNDGQVHEIQEDLPDFFITPYLPTDEDGNPMPDEENIVRQNGMVYVKPNLAYYQQITEEDYIYVRDIDHEELNKIRITGELPPVEAKEE